MKPSTQQTLRKEALFTEGLKRVALFSRLPEGQLDLVAAGCRQLSFSKGAPIIQQTEESYDLYVILSGSVKVTLYNEDGREVVLDTLHEGDFFGELSLLDRKPRSASVSALTDVSMLVLTQSSLLQALRQSPEIAINLLFVLTKRLRKADETIETLAFMNVSDRVSKVLLDFARANGEKMPNGCLKIQCPTHLTIANQIGCSREAVTKTFKSLADCGILVAQGKEMIIDPQKLQVGGQGAGRV